MSAKLRRYTENRIVLWVSIFVSLLSTVFYSSRRIALYDYNYIANAIHRLSLGEMPYREFDLVLPPITFLPGYLFHHFLNFGITTSILITALITQVIALVSIHSILSQIIRRNDCHKSRGIYSIAMIGSGIINVISIYPNFIYDSLASALALVAIAFFLKCQENAKYRFLVLAQLFAVLTLFTKFNMGGSLILGFVLIRILILVNEKKYLRFLTEASSLFIVSACFLLLISTFGLSNFIDQTIIAPSKFKGVTQLGQLAQYNYLILIAMIFLILCARVLRLNGTEITKYTLLLLICFLSMYAIKDILAPSASWEIPKILFPGVNFVYPIIMLVSLNCLLTLNRHKIEILTLLIVLPIYFFGTFLSQGWVGSSYSLSPLLILLIVTIFLSLDSKMREVQDKIFKLFILVLVGNLLILACSGNRLGYVYDGGARGQKYNWNQIGTALSAQDILEVKEINQEIKKSKSAGSIIEFPAEDLLEDFSNKLTPWNRCLQFTFICPSKSVGDILTDFKSEEPNVIVVKQVTQINRGIEPILNVLEPAIDTCYLLRYSNKTYQLFKSTEATHRCLTEYFEVNND